MFVAYLIEVNADPALPILAEVCERSQLAVVFTSPAVGDGSVCGGWCSRVLTIFWLCLIA